jgi:hypothetical protein
VSFHFIANSFPWVEQQRSHAVNRFAIEENTDPGCAKSLMRLGIIWLRATSASVLTAPI